MEYCDRTVCRFDGDGMIHGLNIKDGKATYAARYVQTSRLLQEEHYGASKFVKVGHGTTLKNRSIEIETSIS